MRLTFFGHAAFLVETAGVRIIFDPYKSPDSGGYAPIAEPADIVAVSHENDRYHSHLGQITPPFEVVRGLEVPPQGRSVRGITFHAVRVFETPERLPGDEVTILHLRSEDIHLVHLGDLGHPLSDAEAEPIRNADIMLVPAGGTPTIALDEIPALLEQLVPRVVIPMHYKTPRINLNIQPVEALLERLADWAVESCVGSTIEVTSDSLPAARTVVQLMPCR
jgi:L-ascorbate metabolism protein UlaG (beta-lactamase superfamily)